MASGTLERRASWLMKHGHDRMRQKNILVIGNSHTRALKKALVKKGAEMKGTCDIEIYAISTPSLSGELTWPEALQKCKDLRPDDLVITVIGGNRHSVIGLFQHTNPFSVMCDEFEPNGAVELIPSNVLRADYEFIFAKSDAKLIAQCKEQSPCPVYQLESPPPKQEEEYILKHADPFFRKSLELGAKITPAPVRKELWRLQEDVLRQMCEKVGVGFIRAPKEAISQSGFLRKDCYIGANATHANERYGELVLQQLKQLAQR